MKPSTKVLPKLSGMALRIQRTASEFVDGVKASPNPLGLWRRQLYKDGSSIVETRPISKDKAEKILALWLAAPEMKDEMEEAAKTMDEVKKLLDNPNGSDIQESIRRLDVGARCLREIIAKAEGGK